MTGFAKRDLPHTSNSMNLEDHNLVTKSLKLSPSAKLCWCTLLTKFQVNGLFKSEGMGYQTW